MIFYKKNAKMEKINKQIKNQISYLAFILFSVAHILYKHRRL